MVKIVQPVDSGKGRVRISDPSQRAELIATLKGIKAGTIKVTSYMKMVLERDGWIKIEKAPKGSKVRKIITLTTKGSKVVANGAKGKAASEAYKTLAAEGHRTLAHSHVAQRAA
jgi:hypothetical protein